MLFKESCLVSLPSAHNAVIGLIEVAYFHDASAATNDTELMKNSWPAENNNISKHEIEQFDNR